MLLKSLTNWGCKMIYLICKGLNIQTCQGGNLMFAKKKRQVIRFEQNLCNAQVDDNNILFVRVSDQITDKDALFEVPLTHIAYVVKGGGYGKVYKSGTYPVFEGNKEVKNWQQGISVDIIYMPKDPNVPIKWGTNEKIKYRDEATGKVVGVAAYGVFDVSISNPEQFYRKVVGAKREFSLKEFQDRFSANVLSEFTAIFFQTVDELKLNSDKFDANKKSIQEKTGRLLNRKFEDEWGVSLNNFIIQYIGVSDINRVIEKEDDEEQVKNVNVRGALVKEGDLFCAKCGTKLQKEGITCPSCGKRNDPQAQFCVYCGKKIGEAENVEEE